MPSENFMAPESERALCAKCGEHKNDLVHQPKLIYENRGHYFEPEPQVQVAPASEPTLTCSEVVERLAECAGLNWTDTPASGDAPYATFDTDKAEEILHSCWRERRVQELEEALRFAVATGGLPHDAIGELPCTGNCVRCLIENALGRENGK
jgi:hypothetical protein